MNRIEIKKWLIDAHLTGGDIARDAGVSISLVSKVIKGERHNQEVIEALRKRGCPREYLETEKTD